MEWRKYSEGSFRLVRKFAWLPKQLSTRILWLDFYYVKQRLNGYRQSYYSDSLSDYVRWRSYRGEFFEEVTKDEWKQFKFFKKVPT